MINNRNHYPRYQVWLWITDADSTSDDKSLTMYDEFINEDTARKLYDATNYGDVIDGETVQAVRLEVETKENFRVLMEKDELNAYDYT